MTTTIKEAFNRFNSDNATKESFGNQTGRTNVVKQFEGGVEAKPVYIRSLVEVLYYFLKKNVIVDSFVNIHESALALCPTSRFQPSFTFLQS